jgi:hypothetical protein
MGVAVVKTVLDPETGETMQVMAVKHNGVVRYQRLRSFEERMHTAKAWENLAAFGEASSKSYGTKQTGPDPPSWEVIRKERPKTRLELPGKAELATAKQQRYRALLGNAVDDVEKELIVRQQFRLMPVMTGTARAYALKGAEELLRARLEKASPLLVRRRPPA